MIESGGIMNCCNPFDKLAGVYNCVIRFFANPRKYSELIRDLAKVKPTYVVLDVGGGTGLVAQYLCEDVEELTVLDPSSKMLSKIKSDKIKKVIGSAQDIKFKDCAFDIVYCVDSFHHFTNGSDPKNWNKTIKQCIKELLRVLKINGKLIIIEFDPTTFRGGLIEILENKIMHWGSKFYSRKEFISLFKEYNTKVKILNLNGYGFIAQITK